MWYIRAIKYQVQTPRHSQKLHTNFSKCFFIPGLSEMAHLMKETYFKFTTFSLRLDIIKTIQDAVIHPGGDYTCVLFAWEQMAVFSSQIQFLSLHNLLWCNENRTVQDTYQALKTHIQWQGALITLVTRAK